MQELVNSIDLLHMYMPMVMTGLTLTVTCPVNPIQLTVLYLINTIHTVTPRPEAHLGMILFEVFWKNIHLIPQDQIVQ